MKQQNINLLCIAPYRFLPAVNGGHKAIEQLYKELGLLAKTIVVSTSSNDARLAQHYSLIPLFNTSPLHYINPFYFFRIRKIIKQNNITHLLMEHPYMGWLGFLLKRYAGIVWMVRSHNIEAVRFKTLRKWWWKIMWRYEGWVHCKADFSFFITNDDKQFAVEKYHVAKHKCDVLTYGIHQKTAPFFDKKIWAKTNLCQQYNVPFSNTILLFNGDLGYAPNTKAVEAILANINPLLLQQTSFAYTIFICGKNLPEKVQKQIEIETINIIYTGFVPDVSLFFLAADVFINPVVAGGGIKTKLVEALAYNCSAVSTKSGAAGVHSPDINQKLKVVENDDWKAFATAILTIDSMVDTPASFYEYFYWANIAHKAVNTMLSL